MDRLSFERLPKKILFGFDFQEVTIKELIVEASIDFYGQDAVDVLLDMVFTCIEMAEPITAVLDQELADDTKPERDLKDFLEGLHLRLVATLRSVGCYDKDGHLLYRFMKPIERGFLLERIWDNP